MTEHTAAPPRPADRLAVYLDLERARQRDLAEKAAEITARSAAARETRDAEQLAAIRAALPAELLEDWAPDLDEWGHPRLYPRWLFEGRPAAARHSLQLAKDPAGRWCLLEGARIPLEGVAVDELRRQLAPHVAHMVDDVEAAEQLAATVAAQATALERAVGRLEAARPTLQARLDAAVSRALAVAGWPAGRELTVVELSYPLPPDADGDRATASEYALEWRGPGEPCLLVRSDGLLSGAVWTPWPLVEVSRTWRGIDDVPVELRRRELFHAWCAVELDVPLARGKTEQAIGLAASVKLPVRGVLHALGRLDLGAPLPDLGPRVLGFRLDAADQLQPDDGPRPDPIHYVDDD